MARERGYRAVSVDAAVCEVPRAFTLRSELRRKTRTMARGLATLVYKRHLLNPARYGGFALMLIGHKLLRWLVYPLLPGAVLGIVLLSRHSRLAEGILAGAIAGTVMGIAGLRWPRERVPRMLSACGFVLAATVAGVLAWKQVLLGERSPVWEPTRRPTSSRATGEQSMSMQGDPSSLRSSG